MAHMTMHPNLSPDVERFNHAYLRRPPRRTGRRPCTSIPLYRILTPVPSSRAVLYTKTDGHSSTAAGSFVNLHSTGDTGRACITLLRVPCFATTIQPESTRQ
jgi:hypothetical protein